jgi:hypothetical protein
VGIAQAIPKNQQECGFSGDYNNVIGQKWRFSPKIGGKFFFEGLKNDSGWAIVIRLVISDELKIWRSFM